MLTTLIAFAAALAAFLAGRLLRKRSAGTSLLLALAVLLLGMFAFDKKIAFDAVRRERPSLVLLTDVSKSCASVTNSAEWRALSQAVPARNRWYFADALSRNPAALNAEYTAAADGLHTLLGRLPESARVVLVSDFRDNRSGLDPFSDPRVTCVAAGSPVTGPVVAGFEAPEFVQSGETSQADVTVYSPSAASVAYSLTSGGNGTLRVPAGLSEHALAFRPSAEGFTVVELRAGDSTARRMVDVLPSFYRIYIAAGRPSPEFARVRRFFDGTRWMKCDAKLLVRPGDTVTLPESGYDGMILMDLSDAQVRNPAALDRFPAPVLYATGLRKAAEYAGLLSHFTNLKPAGQASDRSMRIGTADAVVRLAAANVEPLVTVSPSRRVFFGWDTWKWDASAEALGVEENRFGAFWKQQAVFLIAGRSRPVELDRLNYVTGEPNPSGAADAGVHEVPTNGNVYKILVADNPAEASLPPDLETAARFSTNVVTLDSLSSPKAFAAGLTRGPRVILLQHFEFSFRTHWLSYVLLAAALILYWVLADLEGMKR